MAPRDSSTTPSREVGSALTFVALLASLGLVVRWQLDVSGLALPIGTNIFYRLFALHEERYLVLLLLFLACSAGLLVRARGESAGEEHRVLEQASGAPLRVLWISAAGVVLVGLAVQHFVLHGLLFSMDEFSADFQARAFARGEYAPLVPWPWRSLQDAIAPIFVHFHADSGRWSAVYLPVYSGLKAGFLLIGAGALLNPLLSAGSVVVLAAAGRRLWPGDWRRPAAAVAFLVTSSQFLLTSGTGYAMPAHLFLNLLWLWLYLRDDLWSWSGALVVGVLAMGLHNPFPHTLFVAPFIFRLLREGRWGRLASAAGVYLAAAAMWLAYLRFVDPATGGAEHGLLSLFRFPDAGAAFLLLMNLCLLLTWHAPSVGVLTFVALARPRRLPAPLIDLALGLALTLLFFMFYPSTQGHGWGDRYAHQVLGNLCLLAAAGVPTMMAALGSTRARQWQLAALVIALLIQLPLRLRETERFVRPFAAGVDYVRSRKATVVLLAGDSVWYGRDLIRNDPFLRYPVVVRRQRLAPVVIAQMKAMFPGRVYEMSDAELIRLGMTPMAKAPALADSLP